MDKRKVRRIGIGTACLGAMLALSGCYSKPVGVMASEDPSFKGMDVQLAEARLHNFLSDHGTMTLALPNGDQCLGQMDEFEEALRRCAERIPALRHGPADRSQCLDRRQ